MDFVIFSSRVCVVGGTVAALGINCYEMLIYKFIICLATKLHFGYKGSLQTQISEDIYKQLAFACSIVLDYAGSGCGSSVSFTHMDASSDNDTL
jgi:hypothetical protein